MLLRHVLRDSNSVVCYVLFVSGATISHPVTWGASLPTNLRGLYARVWIDAMQVKGFPTLKFVTADGEVLDYSGDRSEEDLVKFIKGHADSKADDPTVRKDEL